MFIYELKFGRFVLYRGKKQELHLCAEISAAKSLDRVDMGGELSLHQDDDTFLDMLRGLWLCISCYHYFSLI